MNEEQQFVPGHKPEAPQTSEAGVEHHEQAETPAKPEKLEQHAEKAPEDDIERIRSSIQQEAKPAEADKPKTERSEPAASPTTIGKVLKDQALFRTLKNLRQHLSPPERGLSKIVHQPVVDAVSEVGGKTVARPSGILGGGICAFLGSLGYLYLAKHIGFHYNYLLFLLLFVGGFAVGIVLELIVRLAFRFKRA